MAKKIFCMVLFAVMSAALSYAAPADISKSGQTTMSATEDDGELQKGIAWPGTRFTTNADTTVTDHLTGLVWAPNGNLMPTRDSDWDADDVANDGKVTWQHALDYVAKLNSESYLVHTDWRLPNVNELESLMHAEYTKETACSGPCASNSDWLNTQGFSNVSGGYYWMSTTCAVDTSNAWFIDTWRGYMGFDSKLDVLYVWPVRGGE